jgi:predicted metalloendopeptidase
MVNRKWIKNHKYVVSSQLETNSFVTIHNKTLHELKTVIEKRNNRMSNVFKSFLNVNKAQVDRYIVKYKTELDLLQEKGTFQQWLSWLQTRHIVHLFSWEPSMYEMGGLCNGEKKDIKKWVSYISPSGLTFIEKDFYFKKTKRILNIKKKYDAYLKHLFQEGFGDDHGYNLHDIFVVEKKMAQYMYPVNKLIPFEKKYNVYSPSSFRREFKLPSDFIFSGEEEENRFGKEDREKIKEASFVVENPEYFRHLIPFYMTHWNTPEMKTYIVYRILLLLSTFSIPLYKIIHGFKYPHFVKIETPTHNAVHFTKLLMNTTLSKAYLAEYENKKEIAFCKDLISLFIQCCIQRFSKNDLFSQSTREKIIKKIKAMEFVVGSKPRYEEDPDIDFVDDDAIGNMEKYFAWKKPRDLERLGSSKTREYWDTLQLQSSYENVYDVNAFYLTHLNLLYIPNAILQKPFIDVEKTAAYNYANVGTLIGHELMHAFDSEGFYYDEDGYRCKKPFWKKEEIDVYVKKQTAIMKVYDDYAVRDRLQIVQKMTIAENIADIGGFLIAEMAFMMHMGKEGYDDEARLKGLKDFYRYYSEKWRSIIKPSVARDMVRTDVHSLSKYRVNCVLAFSDKFHEVVYGNATSPHKGVFPF